MWTDKIEEHYWWAHIEDEVDQLILELSKAEDEEAAELSLLKLHFDNRSDYQFFTPEEEKEIKERLSILVNDTIKHAELLSQAIKQLEEIKLKKS